jgi:hypothetical protein
MEVVKMTDLEIALKVEEYALTLKDVPFDKGQPLLSKYVWDLGDKVGKSGPDIMMIYFNWKSKNK